MNKRGQVTVFVIIGIVIIILILLFLFLRSKVYFGTPSVENLEGEFPQIREHIEECITEVAEPRLEQIALQGGYIETAPDTFRLYNDQRVSILCWNIQDQPYCRSRVRTLANLEVELSDFILRDLQTQCININAFDKAGYDITSGQLEITTTIDSDIVLIEANFPIKIQRGEAAVEESEFSVLIDVPLGRLFESTRDIVSQEAQSGVFDALPYVLAKTQITGKPYIIQKLQPYPDKLYLLKIKDIPSEDNPYIFQFWVQGEPR